MIVLGNLSCTFMHSYKITDILLPQTKCHSDTSSSFNDYTGYDVTYIKYLLHFAEKTFLIKLETVTLQYLTGGRVLEHLSKGVDTRPPLFIKIR